MSNANIAILVATFLNMADAAYVVVVARMESGSGDRGIDRSASLARLDRWHPLREAGLRGAVAGWRAEVRTVVGKVARVLHAPEAIEVARVVHEVALALAHQLEFGEN